MRIEVVSPDALAAHVARTIADELREAVAARGVATLAVSGGGTPTAMLAELATSDLPWDRVHVLQVDERVAADGDDVRNLTLLRATLLDRVPLPLANVHVVPLDDPEGDLDPVAHRYEEQLRAVAGTPAVLDVVQLGLGDDGHTASLVPGDGVLNVRDRDVAVTAPYRGHRRITLTLPAIGRARRIVWMVAGSAKAAAVARLVAADLAIPAGHVPGERSLLLVDTDAAADLTTHPA